MEYNFQIQLNFDQLLQLVSQLPEIEKKRLALVLSDNASWMPALRMRTVDEILSADYKYPSNKPEKLIGAWEGEESSENLISLRIK